MRARPQDGEPEPRRQRVVLHPDLAEALGAAEDALSAALGRPVKVRARGERCLVELEFESPAEAVDLALSLLAPGGRRAA